MQRNAAVTCDHSLRIQVNALSGAACCAWISGSLPKREAFQKSWLEPARSLQNHTRSSKALHDGRQQGDLRGLPQRTLCATLRECLKGRFQGWAWRFCGEEVCWRSWKVAGPNLGLWYSKAIANITPLSSACTSFCSIFGSLLFYATLETGRERRVPVLRE